jgi:hypothetical protein
MTDVTAILCAIDQGDAYYLDLKYQSWTIKNPCCSQGFFVACWVCVDLPPLPLDEDLTRRSGPLSCIRQAGKSGRNID